MINMIIGYELHLSHLTLSRPRGGGVKLPPDLFFAAISEPHGTIRNAFVTFPEYGWATKWHTYCVYIVTQKSKMVAANGGYFLKNLEKPITQVVCKTAEKFQRLYLYFLGPGIQ